MKNLKIGTVASCLVAVVALAVTFSVLTLVTFAGFISLPASLSQTEAYLSFLLPALLSWAVCPVFAVAAE